MIGIDTVKISRMRESIDNSAFTERVFTKTERDYCDSKPCPEQSYAGIFCAKEAAAKAVGIGFGAGIMPNDIEVLHARSGEPKLVFHRKACAVFAGLTVCVSISHDGDYAVAVVEALPQGV